IRADPLGAILLGLAKDRFPLSLARALFGRNLKGVALVWLGVDFDEAGPDELFVEARQSGVVAAQPDDAGPVLQLQRAVLVVKPDVVADRLEPQGREPLRLFTYLRITRLLHSQELALDAETFEGDAAEDFHLGGTSRHVLQRPGRFCGAEPVHGTHAPHQEQDGQSRVSSAHHKSLRWPN